MDAFHIIFPYYEIVAFSVPNSAFSVIVWELEVGQYGFNYIAPLGCQFQSFHREDER